MFNEITIDNNDFHIRGMGMKIIDECNRKNINLKDIVKIKDSYKKLTSPYADSFNIMLNDIECVIEKASYDEKERKWSWNKI